MQKIVIDSDVFIDFLRTGRGLLPLIISLQEEGRIEIYISSVTVFELFAGASSKNDESKILGLIDKLKVIPFNMDLAKYAGEMKRDKKASIALADFFIASSALYIGADIATRNKDHFKGIIGIRFFVRSK